MINIIIVILKNIIRFFEVVYVCYDIKFNYIKYMYLVICYEDIN